MDTLGSIIIGLIAGIILCLLFVKIIANKNKKELLNNKLYKDFNDELENIQSILRNNTASDKEMVVDAIGSGIDQLMRYHGEKVIIDRDYLMCWIDKKPILLPQKCLISINASKESESDL